MWEYRAKLDPFCLRGRLQPSRTQPLRAAVLTAEGIALGANSSPQRTEFAGDPEYPTHRDAMNGAPSVVVTGKVVAILPHLLRRYGAPSVWVSDNFYMAGVIRRAEERDVSALQRLEAATPGMPPWTELHWLGLLAGDSIVVIAEADGQVAGYAVASLLRIPGEVVAELEAVVVASAHRRNGLGNGLLQYLLAEVEAAGAIRLMLEVRTGNGAARALYRGLGFQEEGLRRRYYRDPVEDAVLMSLQFPQEKVAEEKRPE